MLGDVVSGSGGDFGNIAYNFAQIKSMGRTYGIDLRRSLCRTFLFGRSLQRF